MEGEEGEVEEEEAKPLEGWRPGGPVNAAAAVRAFKKCRGDLLKAILVADPLQLANELYSEDIVSKEVCDQILFLNITPTEKSMRLLTAVETRLSGHPSDFTTFITVLEADPTIKAVVNRLNECYVECCRPGVQITLPQISTDPFTVFVASLKAVYRNTSALPSNEEYPTPTTTYTNLAIVKKEPTSRAKADKFTRDTLHGGIDNIMHVKESISIENVLNVEAGGSLGCVLVEGAPGVGKSMFAQQICRQWDTIKAISRFAVVVLLRLREKRVQNAISVADLFYHDIPHIQQCVVERITSSGGDKVLLVLDGFDEFPVHLRKRSFIAQVIQGTCLSIANITILVTSRPSARADLLKLRPYPEKHIEVLGFTSDLIDQYANSTLGSDPPLRADFCTYLGANPVIKSMMYIPLHSAIVAEIYRENRVAGRPIPQTMTQLYTELTLTRLRNHLHCEAGSSQVDLPTDLKNLPQDIYDQLLSLAKLAYEGTLKERVIFDKLPDGCSSLGLMVVSQELYVGWRGSLSYNFFHLTLQEFLSAFYISKLPGTERKKLLRRVYHMSHMKVVRNFVAGLVGLREIGWHPTSDAMGRLTVNVSMLHEWFEAQEDMKYELSSTVVFVADSSLTVLDCFALGFCVAASGNAWKITFPFQSHHTNCSWPEMVHMLTCGLRSRAEVKGYIQQLGLRKCLRGPKDLLLTNELPKGVLQRISCLIVSDCNLEHVGFDLLADIVVTMTSLRELAITSNPGGDGALVKLLNTGTCLHELYMHSTLLGCDDVIALSHLIRPSGSLKILQLGDHSFSSATVEFMLRAVLSPSSLEDLHIVYTDLSFASFAELEQNCNLTQLEFTGCTMPNKAIQSIAYLIHKNTTLKKLNLWSVNIPVSDLANVDGTVVALADMLKVNHTLNRLRLSLKGAYRIYRSVVTMETLQTLINTLQYNHMVEELTLNIGRYHGLSHEAMMKIQKDDRLKLL